MEQGIPKRLNAQQIMIAIIIPDLSLDGKKRVSLLPLIVTARSQSPVVKHAPHNRNRILFDPLKNYSLVSIALYLNAFMFGHVNYLK